MFFLNAMASVKMDNKNLLTKKHIIHSIHLLSDLLSVRSHSIILTVATRSITYCISMTFGDIILIHLLREEPYTADTEG